MFGLFFAHLQDSLNKAQSQERTFREEASQRTESKSRPPVEITARRALHAAAIAMAMDLHCGDACIQCAGQGKTYYIDTMQHAVCPWCHGFGKRELKPARPSYTVHGAVGPMSFVNSQGVA